MFSLSWTRYSYLPQTDVSAEVNLPEKSRPGTPKLLEVARQACFWALLIGSGFIVGFNVNTGSMKCSPQVGHWSPQLPKLKSSATKFNGSFEFSGPFRGKPSPEIDHEWDRFTEHPLIDGTPSLISVNRDDISHSNKSSKNDGLNSTVEYSKEAGGGYMATLELFHQLHCLNMLRKAVHPEYYTAMATLANGTRNPRQAAHLDHCVEILRQFIGCYADTGLITFHWVKGNYVPYPDFNTWHQCRDPEEVLRWSKTREVKIKTLMTKQMFADIVEMPFAP